MVSRFTLVFTIFTVLLAGLASSSVGFPFGDKKSSVSLEAIYAVPSQKAHRTASDATNTNILNELRTTKSTMPNLMIVNGKEIEDALKATRDVVFGSSFGNSVPTIENSKDKHWIVVYLGRAGSSPPAWTIHSVDVQEKTIKIKVTRPKTTFQTLNSTPYFFWVPLGELKAQKYDLVLFDINDNETEMTRRIVVHARTE